MQTFKVLPSKQNKIPNTPEDCKVGSFISVLNKQMYVCMVIAFVNMYNFLISIFKYAVII